MTESDALPRELKPQHIGHLNICWLRFLFPLLMRHYARVGGGQR